MARRANGEGTIHRRKDGLWEGKVFVLTPEGGRKRRTVYGKSQAQVRDKLTSLRDQVRSGVVSPNSVLTVDAYLTDWLADVAHRSVRPSTYRAYEMFVRVHLVPALGTRKLDRLTAGDVRRLVNAKLDAGASAATVRKMHAVLRAALEQAVRDELLVRNVARSVRVPMPRPPEVQPYTEAEARQLLEAAKDDRLYALWAVALSLGLRKGEALGLRWADVDLDQGWVRVRQTVQRTPKGLEFLPPKTPRSRRTIPMPTVCVRALREHRARQNVERLGLGLYWQDHDLVFPAHGGTPLDPDNVNRELDKLCARADVRRVRVHDLRHTCATLLLAQGVPARVVMEILGHSQISVTLNTYTHVVPALQLEAMSRMDDILDPGVVDGVVDPPDPSDLDDEPGTAGP